MIKRCCIRLLFTCYIKKFNSVILSFCISAEFYFRFGRKVPGGVCSDICETDEKWDP